MKQSLRYAYALLESIGHSCLKSWLEQTSVTLKYNIYKRVELSPHKWSPRAFMAILITILQNHLYVHADITEWSMYNSSDPGYHTFLTTCK